MATKTKGKKTASAKKTVNVPPMKVKTVESKKPKVDLEGLRKPVAEAKTVLDKARGEANGLAEKARLIVEQAKTAYLRTLAPYRDACRRAGAKCAFEGGRGGNITDMVRFEVEKSDRGVRVRMKGRPKTEETIPFDRFKESSISAVAYAYTEKHIGPREKVGNKGGSLSNKIRFLLQGAKKA